MQFVKQGTGRKIEKRVGFAHTAHLRFMRSSHEERRDIMVLLGQRIILKEKVLELTPVPWFIPIQKGYKDLETEYRRLEPKLSDGIQMSENEKAALTTLRSTWLGRRDSNPRMPGPEPGALPLGDSPSLLGGL